MNKPPNLEINDTEVVEVVLKKNMSVSDYRRIYNDSKKKGWHIQAYKLGYYQDNREPLKIK